MKNLVLLLVLVVSSVSMAIFIPLQNSGFETPVLDESGFSNTNLTGWTNDTPARAFRIWNVDNTYPVQPTEGNNFMWLAPAGSSFQMSQIASTPIEAGKQYSLSFDVAMVSTFGGAPAYTATVYTTTGGSSSRIASRLLATTGSVTIPLDNVWRTVTLTWDSTGTAFAGEKLDIILGGKAMIDNVQLSVVPEPATIAVMGLGLLFSRIKRR